MTPAETLPAPPESGTYLTGHRLVAVNAQRLVIGGGPRTGKTTLALDVHVKTGVRVRHTDSVKHLGWSPASEEVATWFDRPGAWIVEGTAAVRGLRKWLAANPTGRPCDAVAWFREAVVERTPGQEAMAKGCETILAEILPELTRRGVVFQVVR